MSYYFQKLANVAPVNPYNAQPPTKQHWGWDAAETAMDVGTSFIPVIGSVANPVWNLLKAGYRGMTGQKDKAKQDLAWAAAGLIPFSGVGKGIAKGIGVGSKILKNSTGLAKAMPGVINGAAQMGGGMALSNAVGNGTDNTPTAPVSPVAPPPVTSPTPAVQSNPQTFATQQNSGVPSTSFFDTAAGQNVMQ